MTTEYIVCYKCNHLHPENGEHQCNVDLRCPTEQIQTTQSKPIEHNHFM
jgi:hypothetical protein